MPQRFFLDTSALIVRYLRRAVGHAWVQRICDDASHNTITIAEITEAELAATMNQLVRGGLMRNTSCKRVLSVFLRQVDGNEYRILPITSSVIRRAASLCDVHSLKGYDAIQLACALTYRDDVRIADAAAASIAGAPLLGDPIFLAEDKRLGDAARAEGFTVDTPAAHP
ncbi:MAG: type II toxin-antitoxin system VapC family toxin [Ktedonobacterales bacterium]